MSEEIEEERADKYLRTEIERGIRKRDAGDNEEGEATRRKSDKEMDCMGMIRDLGMTDHDWDEAEEDNFVKEMIETEYM